MRAYDFTLEAYHEGANGTESARVDVCEVAMTEERARRQVLENLYRRGWWAARLDRAAVEGHEPWRG